MSDTTASLRCKIGSAGDLRSVVRTMKALAASNIGQYEQSVRALCDYYLSVELGLSICFQKRAAAVMAESAARPNEGSIGAVRPQRKLPPDPPEWHRCGTVRRRLRLRRAGGDGVSLNFEPQVTS